MNCVAMESMQLVKGQNLELSVKERHIEVETITSEQQCQIKQQIQEKELRPPERIREQI